MRDEVHPPEVHGFVAAVEADVAFLGLARVARWADHQPLDVGQNALVLGVGVHSVSSVQLAIPTDSYSHIAWIFCRVEF